MSIPERLFRIAKYKLTEIKERIERLDEETQRDEEELRRLRRSQSKGDARRELEESLRTPSDSVSANPPISTQAPPPRRTPEEIARGIPSRAGNATTGGTVSAPMPHASDALAYHYRLLGLEPGAGFAEVQAAYNRFVARCDTSRFPAGSAEEQEAREIKTRLDASYKILRDALDPTARRFDLLEFDTPEK
jgi:hypothetical protein